MGTIRAQRAVRARTAIVALLASGAMTILGPASISLAAPAGDNVDGASFVEGSHSTPPALAQIRAVVRHFQLENGDDNRQLQMALDRRGKALSTISNILKKHSDSLGRILGNLK